MFLVWLIKTTFLLLVVWAISHLRGLSASFRHLVGALALVSVPLLWLLEGVLSPTWLSFDAPALVLDLTGNLERVVAGIALEPGIARESSPTGVSSLGWWFLGSVIYLVGALFALLLLGRRLLLTHRWVCSLRILHARTQVVDLPNVQFHQTQDNNSPFAWGLFKSRIVVPACWQNWHADKQRSVLLHEFAHLRRKDLLVGVVSYVICAFSWFNPFVWFVRRRCMLLAEHACDDWVIAQGVSGVSYAQQLLEITKNNRPLVTPAMASKSELGARIRALLNDNTRRNPMSKKKMTLVVVLASMLMFALGGVTAGVDQSELTGAMQNKLALVKTSIDNQEFAKADEQIRVLLADKTVLKDELGQIYNLQAYAFFQQDDHVSAIETYQKVLAAERQQPSGLTKKTLYTLAQLNFVQEDYVSAVEYIQRWQALVAEPWPHASIFIGQSYYQLEDYTNALAHVEQGITDAQTQGMQVSPNWTKLRDYLATMVAEGDGLSGDASSPLLSGDGDIMPFVKFVPIYPQAAKDNKIEGYVLVEFSVGIDGWPLDLVVIEAQPNEIFDAAALAAVRKFKYKPRVLDGEPVIATGIRNRILFELDES